MILAFFCLDWKSARWWGECIFQNGEGSMVGSYEEGQKFGWMTSVWKLFEWQVEM
jgi:hypothetical protein